MKFLRYRHDGLISEGILFEETVQPIAGSFFSEFSLLDEQIPLIEVEILAPCTPGKILCVGLNYRDHAEEIGLPIPQWPVIFSKAPTSVIGHWAGIVYPEHFVTRLDYEGELAVVIKKTAKNVREEDADEYILGCTCANDVTARNLQAKDGQWVVAKSFDTFLPLGPVIVTDLDYGNLDVVCRLNGEVKQSSNTRHLIFSVPYLVSYLSKVMTLLPGDVIITGTPAGIGPMQIGDIVTVDIGGIGELNNPVVG